MTYAQRDKLLATLQYAAMFAGAATQLPRHESFLKFTHNNTRTQPKTRHLPSRSCR